MSTLPQGSDAGPSFATRFHVDEDVKRDAQGAVKTAIELLGVAASMTQNVPYLGIVSGILTEIVKMEDEVDTYKQEWRATMTSARQIKAVVENVLPQCSSATNTEDELPTTLREPLFELERCLVKTVETLNRCQAGTGDKQSVSRIKRVKARIRERISRKSLLNEVQQCRRDMQAALHLFNTKLQIDQSLKIHAIGPILAQVRERQYAHSVSFGPKAIEYSMEVLPAAPAIFHGREGEIEHVVNLIKFSAPARVAILGPGGIGKTSIALAILNHPEIARFYARRRFFVSCEALTSADAIVLELLRVFGLVYDSKSGLVSQDYLLYHLRTFFYQPMLCLDNIETPWDGDVQPTEALLSKLAELPQLTLLITSRGTDRPMQVAWTHPFLAPIEPLTSDAALTIWNGICGSYDEFAMKLVHATDCVPLAVTLLAHLAESETAEVLWERWQYEQTELLRTRGSNHRLTNIETSIQLSLCSPRLRDGGGAVTFLSVLCTLPQGIPESRIPTFAHAFVDDLPDLRRSITLLKQCSLVYSSPDGFLRVLSPVRHYMQNAHPIAITFLIHLFNHYRKIVTFPTTDYKDEKAYTGANIRNELMNVSKVFTLYLPYGYHSHRVPPVTEALEAVVSFLHLSRTVLHYDLALIDQALDCVGGYHLPAIEAKLCALRGLSQFDTLSTHDALPSFSRALGLYTAVDDRQGKAACLNAMSDVYSHLDQLQEAEQTLHAALCLYESLETRHGAASIRQKLGRLYLQLGRLTEAHTMLDTSIKVFIELHDCMGYANGLQAMGELCIRTGQFEQAEDLLQNALREYGEVGDSRGEAVTLLSLGSLYHNTSRLEDAEQTLRVALDIYRRSGDRLGEASGSEIMGMVYQHLDQLEKAELYLNLALNLNRSMGSQRGEAKTQNRLGSVYRYLRRYGDAGITLQAAYELSTRISYTVGQGNACRNLGLLARDKVRYAEAEHWLRMAQGHFETAQHTRKLIAIQRDLEILFTLRLRSHTDLYPENVKSHSDPETSSLRRSSSRASSVDSRRR